MGEINTDGMYFPNMSKLIPKKKTEFDEVKSLSDSLKYVVEDYQLMRDCIYVIHRALKEDIDVSSIAFRFKSNELRTMFMEILNDIFELKKIKKKW